MSVFIPLLWCIYSGTLVQPKTVVEYPIPGAVQTHELVGVNNNECILISQITSSSIVKVNRDPDTGLPVSANQFTISSPFSGLHGLRPSKAYPGKVWATLQFDSKLLLLDPKANKPTTAPKIEKTIAIPKPGRGPHVVIEEGDDLWVTLKDSNYVLRINHKNPEDYTLYPCDRKPIFVAKHSSGLVYASQDQSSKILRIDPNTGITGEHEISPSIGATPVGLITGPDGNIWFSLAGSSTNGGTGTFGKIDKNDQIQWFSLNTSLGKTSGLLHLAFEQVPEGSPPRLYLLGSSIVSSNFPDGVFTVTFDENYSAIDTQSTTIFPTQQSQLHRIWVTPGSLFVTALATSGLVQVPTLPVTELPRDEDADPYDTFGLGVKSSNVKYKNPMGNQ